VITGFGVSAIVRVLVQVLVQTISASGINCNTNTPQALPPVTFTV
jgi:hypothetical protein